MSYIVGAIVGLCVVDFICSKKNIDTTVTVLPETLRNNKKYIVGKGYWYVIAGGVVGGLVGIGVKYAINLNNKNQ